MHEAPLAMPELLPFTMPPLCRVAWASTKAREAWEERLKRTKEACDALDWLSVAHGLRACALLKVPLRDLPLLSSQWVSHDLRTLCLDAHADPSAPHLTLVVGSGDVLRAFGRAHDAGDGATMAEALGFPACCHSAYEAYCAETGGADGVWRVATVTKRPEEARPREIDLPAVWQTNPFWRFVGLRSGPHIPCAFGCGASITIAERWTVLGRARGYDDEMGCLEEMLSWPLAWSSLHGLAEIKTPVLRLVTNSDPTAQKHEIRLHSARFPMEGAQGIAHPYQSARAVRFTESKAYRRGLDHASRVVRGPEATS